MNPAMIASNQWTYSPSNKRFMTQWPAWHLSLPHCFQETIQFLFQQLINLDHTDGWTLDNNNHSIPLHWTVLPPGVYYQTPHPRLFCSFVPTAMNKEALPYHYQLLTCPYASPHNKRTWMPWQQPPSLNVPACLPAPKCHAPCSVVTAYPCATCTTWPSTRPFQTNPHVFSTFDIPEWIMSTHPAIPNHGSSMWHLTLPWSAHYSSFTQDNSLHSPSLLHPWHWYPTGMNSLSSMCLWKT